ncbi:MAG: aldo/keto reductase [Planctomycetota bacterium]|jgi:aryl-alcohol dehydrogenase-like predicted oxidoreductase
MDKIRLGRTGLMVTRSGFGALPIQRVDFETARRILRAAVAGGINFIDTARGYTDSEEKIGHALADLRDEIILATKIGSRDRAGLLENLAASLANMKTDHVDILQLHNPPELPDPADPDSAYAGLIEAKERGLTRFVGITNHRLDVALAAVRSGLFDTIQFPFSAISAERDMELVEACKAADVGLIAMKALCGGLLTDIPAALAFFRQFDNVVPIWGIQRDEELAEFLALEADPPALDEAMRAAIEKDRAELAGDFCRGCGYCLPCPAEIPIPMAARMAYLLRRSPTARLLGDEWQEKMRKITECTDCGQCSQRCPYELDTPSLLRKMYEDYCDVLAANR